MVNRMKNRRDRKERKGFVYQARDPKEIKERAKQTGGVFDSIFKDGVDVFKASGGTNTVRILPPTWEDPEHYGYDVFVHGYVGADSSSYLCPKKMKNKPCPICDAAKEAKDAGEDEEAKKLAAKKRSVVWVLERDGEVETPQIWSMSWTQDRDIAVLCENERTGKILQIDHPEKGFDVSFKRKGEKLNTEYYGWKLDHESSPIEEDEDKQEEVLEYIKENPIPDMLKFYDAKHLQAVIEGSAGGKDEDMDDDADDDDDRPRRGKGKRRRDDDDDDGDDDRKSRGKRRRVRDDDDDDMGDADDDTGSDDDDDDAPRSRRKSRRSRDDDDDDDDDADADADADDTTDDDDDDAPRSRRKGRKARDDDDDNGDDDDRPRSRRRSRSRDDDDDADADAGDDDDTGTDADDDDADERPRRRGGKGSRRDDDDDDDGGSRRKRGRRVRS